MTTNAIHEVWGKGRGSCTADERRWLVATYNSAGQANEHAERCRAFLAQAAAMLPPTLRLKSRDIAFDNRGNPLDPQRPQNLQFDSLHYEVSSREVRTEVPTLDIAELWPALDAASDQCATMVLAAQIHWTRDEVQEGAPAEPAPEPEQLAWRLWENGIHPDRPALNALPGETGAQAFRRLMQAALDEFRASRRKVSA